MVFITGGSGQGKREFAKEFFPENIVMPAYQIAVEKYVRDGKDPVEQTVAMLQMNSEIVIIMSEMGGGMEPTDPFEKRLREAVGRVGCYLANEADAVFRITAGIGTRIK